MNIFDRLSETAKKSLKKVVFTESTDHRILKATSILIEKQFAVPVLVGNKDDIIQSASTASVNLSGIEVIDPTESEYFEQAAQLFFDKRRAKGITIEQAQDTMKNPLFFGAALVSLGYAHSCISGAVNTTGDVLRAAIQVIGLKSGSKVVSSVFLMTLKDGRTFTYGDCAVVPYPDSLQLASIAMDSAETHQKLVGEEPLVALLSFSTKGSAKHERIEIVKEALSLVKQENPHLKVDGELQFDAAFVPEIAERKSRGSEVAGKANVFIFPNLDAGNIAYKITERLAGAVATGPIIQGLAKPMLDLSRGASWQDVLNTTLVSLSL